MQPAAFKKGTNVQRHRGARTLGLKDAVRKTLQVRKNPARLFPSARTSTLSNSRSKCRRPSGRKRQHSFSLVRGKTDGALKNRCPPLRSTRLISATAAAGFGKIFQYLRADYEIELLVPKRQRLSRGSNIHEWSRLQVNRNVASGSRLQQRTIRLQPSPNIEHAQPALWQAIQSRLENPPPPAQDQPIRISQRGMQSLSTLPLNLFQGGWRRHGRNYRYPKSRKRFSRTDCSA